ncbi:MULTISPECIES: hypothetical protein [Flavobacteriaceae]|uniref:hypothetical protein n=1 Tax=Flavobacteriaceae TaxID=49546 RepID=UPI00149176B2|nr:MULTISPECIES: hypothetical protein [Allomuricauda]MDC6364704.1 hypothetical protein [Muricauda sp. AC10]
MKTLISILFVATIAFSSKNETTTINYNSPLNGFWVSEDKETRSITKCNIRYNGEHFEVHVWGACLPQDCDWGEMESDSLDKDVQKFNLLWDHEFAERDMLFEMSEGKLKITSTTSYKDNSGRATRTNIEYFIKE